MALTPKQQQFVSEYLVDLNATQAAIRAGYSAKTANQQGARLLTNVGVAAAITSATAARLERSGSTAERVIEELALLAHSDIRQAVREDGSPYDLHELPDEIARAVSSLEVVERKGRDGSVEVTRRLRLWDKNAALGNLARYHRLLTEKHEVTGRDGAPLYDARSARKLSDAELRAEIERLLAQMP